MNGGPGVKLASSVLAVIVNWNTSSETLACVGHLAREYPGLSILVLDNGSRTDEVESLERALPDGSLEPLPLNLGYAHGVNRGFLAAKAGGYRWVWLINPDSRPRPGCLELLMANSHGAVALSPRQASSLSYKDMGAAYASAAMIRRGRVTPLVCIDGADTHEVNVLTGTGLLVDVQAAFGVGLLDERFFHYKEEFDFTERLARVGKLRLVCAAQMWHARGASLAHGSPTAEYYLARNELLYLKSRYIFGRVQPRTARFVLRSLKRALDHLRDGRRTVARGILEGLADGMRGRGGIRPDVA
jgi:GT2 family glycosyltransferase